MDSTFFLHEKVKLPLYHVWYDVLVGPRMEELIRHVEMLYPGISLEELDPSSGGYTCVLKHSRFGTILVMMISTDMSPGLPSLQRRISHEAVHMSWNILEGIGIPIDADSHESQAYIVEEIVDKVSEIVDKLDGVHDDFEL